MSRIEVEQVLGVIRDYMMDVSDTDASNADEIIRHCRIIYDRLGSGEVEPIDMVLHCPACGLQHIDEPKGKWDGKAWDNPPHRSHLCHGCGHIWRPADVATNGVAAIQTKGKADSPIAALRQPAPRPGEE